jgi:hypothetical protein
MRNGKSYAEAGRLGAIKTHELRKERFRLKVEEYNKSPSKCKECNVPLDYTRRSKKFCGRSCAAKHNNRILKKESGNVCLFCGKEIRRKNKYCSNKCQNDHKWENTLKKINENNGFDPTDSYGKVRSMRRYLRETMGCKCAACGLDTWQNKPIPLTMDHIDGNSSNNSISNLRLICCNCDALTPTYKGRNRGKGRSYRRDRYAEGKSW